MKKSIALQLGILALAAGAYQAKAATYGLADWCVNVNGNLPAASCNGSSGGGGALPAGTVNLGSFDKTPELSSTNVFQNNGLGSITINLAAGSNQFVSFYADYDVDYGAYLSDDDSAAVHGALPAGGSYEIDDPNSSNIFSDFQANGLSGKNNVGPGTAHCCDVSFALSFGNLTVPAGDTGAITFSVTTAPPASGFYIQQTNETAGDSIYLAASPLSLTKIGGGGGTGAPEPPTFLLGLGLVGIAAALKRLRAA